jgi:3-methyl-2-oxobutanoate hydroxymethyltransferase
MHDLLGLEDRFKPKFVKRFASLADDVRGAVGAYATEVRARTFPSVEHTFSSAPRPAEAPPETAPAGAGYGPRE